MIMMNITYIHKQYKKTKILLCDHHERTNFLFNAIIHFVNTIPTALLPQSYIYHSGSGDYNTYIQ